MRRCGWLGPTTDALCRWSSSTVPSFAPYAAAERWPLVVALSRFGTFTQLGEVQSSPSTAFADLATFSLLAGEVLEPGISPSRAWSATAP